MPDNRSDQRAGRSAPRRARRTAVVASLLAFALPVPAALGAAAPRAGAALPVPPVPHASRGDLLLVTPSASRVSAWTAADLTSALSAVPIAGNVAVAQGPLGQLEAVGRTATGEVELFASSAGTRGFTASDLTQLATAPAAAGEPTIAVDPRGVTHVFYRTGTGTLEELENDRRTTSDPWFSSNLSTLTSATLSPTITGNPVALAVPGAPLQVFVRTAGGQLGAYALTTIPLHPWYYENVSGLAGAPSIVGSPAAAPAPDGYAMSCAYATSATGTLLEFCNDDANLRLWSVRSVSAAVGLPAVGSAPSVLSTTPLQVAVTSTAGHLLVVGVGADDLSGTTVRDVSAAVRQRLVPTAAPSITALGAGYAVAGQSLTHHLVVFQVAALSKGAAVSVSDATMQLETEQVAGDAPVVTVVGGTPVVLVASGGFIGLAARIVLAAASQDQLHQAVTDDPANTNCNPYTAVFQRGTTAGCAPGTAQEEWCSDFADWVWTAAGVATTGIDGASASFVTWGRARHQFLQGIAQVPAVGDAVVWGVLNPLWGSHVGIVVGVKGREIDVISGNSGGYAHTSGVWESGWFAPASMTAQGDPIIGYVSPVPLPSGT